MGLVKDLLYTNKTGLLAKKALNLHADRASLTVSNIANADTPGYKAVKMRPFEDDLKSAFRKQAPLTTTNPRHIAGSAGDIMAFQPTYEISTETPRLDGNNVNLDTEVSDMAQNSVMYQAIIKANSKRGKLISASMEPGR